MAAWKAGRVADAVVGVAAGSRRRAHSPQTVSTRATGTAARMQRHVGMSVGVGVGAHAGSGTAPRAESRAAAGRPKQW